MKKLHQKFLVLAAVFFAVPAFAAAPYASLSGGVTSEERASFAASHQDYALNLEFAGPGGEYVADVQVSIKNPKGEEVVNTVATGPVLLVALPAGTYGITATLEGEVVTQNVTIAGGQKKIVLRFRQTH